MLKLYLEEIKCFWQPCGSNMVEISLMKMQKTFTGRAKYKGKSMGCGLSRLSLNHGCHLLAMCP